MGGFLLPATAQQINTSGAASSGVTSANVQNQAASCAADTGAADVYVVTLSPAPSAYASLQRFCFKAVSANATTTPTLNVNGLGAKTITKNGGAALAANDIKAGQVVDVEYDGTNLQMQSTLGNAASGGSVSVSGTSVSSPNFVPTPFSAYAGSALGSFGSNINAGNSFPQNTNAYVFGDSTDMVSNASNGDSAAPAGLNGLSGYAGEICSNLATGMCADWAAGGDQWEDMTVRLFTHLSDWWIASNATGQYQTATIVMKPGINNASFKQSSTYLTTITRPVIYAALTAAAIHSQSVTFGQAAGCVKTGSWSTDNTTFVSAISPVVTVTGIAEVSQTNGDTIACPIVTTSNSPVGIIWYGMVDSNLGTFSLSSSAGACTDVVTGGTTINAFGGAAIATHNSGTVTIGAALCPLTAGSYTMTATINTGSSGATKKVWILGMGALPAFPGHRSTVSPVLLGGVLRDRTDTDPTWTGNYDQENMNAAGRLSAAYNFPIQFVPIHTYTVATLPAAPLTGAVADVNDASTATSCASGSGSNVIRCRYNGSSWDAQIGGVPPINMPTTTGFYTDALHPNRLLHALIYEQFAPFLPARTSSNMASLGIVIPGNGTASTGSGAPIWCFTGTTASVALGNCGALGAINGNLDLSGDGTNTNSLLQIRALNIWTGDHSSITTQCGETFCLFSSTSRFGFTNGAGSASEDTTFRRLSAGIFKVDTTSSNADGMISAKGFLSPNVVHVTAQTATKTIYTLCAAATGGCNAAGQYRISWYFNQGGTACGTPGTGGVTFALTWVDNAGTHSAVALPMDDASSLTATGTKFTAQSANTSAWASGVFNIWSTGASAIQITNTYTACSVGTLTWELAASAERVQ